MRGRMSPAHGGRYGEMVARKAGLVGRDDVLGELRRVVDETVAGRGHLLLAGEAGIGKTSERFRLFDEVTSLPRRRPGHRHPRPG
jgi:hypothetical protein